MIQNTEERSTTGVTNSLSGDQWKYKIKGKSRIRFIKTDPGKEIQCSEDGFKIGKWQREEHLQFLKACEKHGNNWAKVFYENLLFYFMTFNTFIRYRMS